MGVACNDAEGNFAGEPHQHFTMLFPSSHKTGTLGGSLIFNVATRALTSGGFTCNVEPFEVGALVNNQRCTT